jgi:hypothetical protein
MLTEHACLPCGRSPVLSLGVRDAGPIERVERGRSCLSCAGSLARDSTWSFFTRRLFLHAFPHEIELFEELGDRVLSVLCRSHLGRCR